MAAASDPPSTARCDFSALAGWAGEDHRAAFTAFRTLCGGLQKPPKTGALGVDGAAVLATCARALALPADPTADAARHFFETHFRPERLTVAPGAGFLTGYFEPEIEGSRTPDASFPVPLYRRPPDLVKVSDANRTPGLDPALELARQTPAGLVEHPDRAAIEAGALAGKGLELVWLKDPLDAYFTHIQGSARIRLADGSVMRVAYAGKSGQPYTAIGRFLIDDGTIPRDAMTMERLRAWLAENPQKARVLMNRNRSYIFFREVTDLDPAAGPVGAAGVPLIAGRSLAVDRRLHTFGTPVWIAGALPLGADGATAPVDRLTFATDTGSAIVGPARGDLFLGSGAEAGRIAGALRHPVDMVMLVPLGAATCKGGSRAAR